MPETSTLAQAASAGFAALNGEINTFLTSSANFSFSGVAPNTSSRAFHGDNEFVNVSTFSAKIQGPRMLSSVVENVIIVHSVTLRFEMLVLVIFERKIPSGRFFSSSFPLKHSVGVATLCTQSTRLRVSVLNRQIFYSSNNARGAS